MFGRLPTKLYSVYIDPDAEAPHETAEFVEEHFALWGFVFHGLWCLYHGLWVYAGLVLLTWTVFVTQNFDILPFDLGLKLSLFTTFTIEFVLRLIVGFEGNLWRGSALLRKGYILSDVVSGESDLAAKRRFFDNWLAQQGETLPASSRG